MADWFWKPALSNLLLKQGLLQDSDVLVYVDTDFALQSIMHSDTDAYLQGVIHNLSRNDVDMVIAPPIVQYGPEWHWTKGDIFKAFNTTWDSDFYGKPPQLTSQRFAMRINSRTREFLRKWEDLASDFHLISDEQSVAPNAPEFNDNRHDQSLFSKYGTL